MKKGDRVIAISHSEGNKLYSFGEGEYLGDTVPTGDDLGWMGRLLKEEGVPNPTILLDNGSIIYGCECWWGAADLVRSKVDGREIVYVQIEEVRKHARDGD